MGMNGGLVDMIYALLAIADTGLRFRGDVILQSVSKKSTGTGALLQQ